MGVHLQHPITCDGYALCGSTWAYAVITDIEAEVLERWHGLAGGVYKAEASEYGGPWCWDIWTTDDWRLVE